MLGTVSAQASVSKEQSAQNLKNLITSNAITPNTYESLENEFLNAAAKDAMDTIDNKTNESNLNAYNEQQNKFQEYMESNKKSLKIAKDQLNASDLKKYRNYIKVLNKYLSSYYDYVDTSESDLAVTENPDAPVEDQDDYQDEIDHYKNISDKANKKWLALYNDLAN